jgi:shikimate 5-dehydrogenase
VSEKQFDTTVPYVDKVKSVKNTGFPNRGERYGAKYENGVAYLLSYTVSVEKLWTQNTRIIHDVWRLLILSNEEKTNDYENFEKGMIYMNILKKGW